MKKILLLGSVLVASTALAFGGGGSGRKATYEPGLVAIGVHFGGNGQAHIDVNCPEGSSTSGQGGETGIYDGDVMCKCDAADKVYTVNGCELQPEVCTNHTTNQCGLGYYCQFSPLDCMDSGRGDGVCTAITGGDDSSGHWVGPTLDWWSANSWCIGKGSSGSITYSTLQSAYGCDKSSYSCNWSALNADGLSSYYWSAEDYGDSCFAWFVSVLYEDFNGYYRNGGTIYALCE